MPKLTDAERRRIVTEIVEQLADRLDASIRMAVDRAVNRALGDMGGARGRAMIRYQPNPDAPARGRAMIRYQPNPDAPARGRAMIRYQPNPSAEASATLEDLVITTTRTQVRQAIQEAFAALGMKLPAAFRSGRRAQSKRPTKRSRKRAVR